METASIELWHGSSHVIKHPEYGLVSRTTIMAADSIARAASSWPRNGRARDWMTVSRIGTR